MGEVTLVSVAAPTCRLQTPASIVQIRFQTVGPVRSDTQTDFMEAAHLGFAELADLGTSNEVDKAMCTCRS